MNVTHLEGAVLKTRQKRAVGVLATALQESEDIALVGPIDLCLFEKGQHGFKPSARTDMADAIHDFHGAGAWLLQTELVAREAENDDIFVDKVLSKCIYLLVG